MKVLFNRFRSLFKRAHSKVKDSRADPFSRSFQKGKPPLRPPQLPPLPEWPPLLLPLEQSESDIGTQTSITSYKPLPELSPRPLPPIEDSLACSLVPFSNYDPNPISISLSRGSLSDVGEEDSVEIAVVTRRASLRSDQDSAERSSCKTGNASITTTNGSNGIPKQVAFYTPPSTPPGLNADRPLPEDASTSNDSTVIRSQTSRLKDSHGSMSTATFSSCLEARSTINSSWTVETTSTTFWGEGAEEDLVTCLGSRERTRQEVLWEIVASEERYGFYACLVNKSVNCSADILPSCLR